MKNIGVATEAFVKAFSHDLQTTEWTDDDIKHRIWPELTFARCKSAIP